MEQLTLEQKACRIIELLVSDDFCQDLEFKIAVHNDYTLTKEDTDLINQKFSTIYRLSHSANPNHTCKHEEWQKEIETRYQNFIDKGELPI